MKFVIAFLIWCGLCVLCWPVALLALILIPVVWVIALPFRLIALCVESLLALVRAVLLLPARLLGHGKS